MRFIAPRLQNSSFGNTGIRARRALLRKTAALNAFSNPFLKARVSAPKLGAVGADAFRSDPKGRPIHAARRDRGATGALGDVLSLRGSVVNQPRKTSKREQIALCPKPRDHA